MKRSLVALALMGAALSACGDPKVKSEPEAVPDQAAAAEPAVVETPTAPATPAASGAPTWAVLYPGAEPAAPATTAQGPGGAGGMIEFHTAAAPDAVIDFYKQRAQAARLSPVSALDQGQTRAWSAADPQTGAGLQVVASPDGEGATSVLLSWSAGR